MNKTAFKIIRCGALWFDSNYMPYSAEYDDITEMYYFQDIMSGKCFNIVKVINENEVIIG